LRTAPPARKSSAPVLVVAGEHLLFKQLDGRNHKAVARGGPVDDVLRGREGAGVKGGGGKGNAAGARGDDQRATHAVRGVVEDHFKRFEP
jgi:hypothetical protein